jgi:hypothetical protein
MKKTILSRRRCENILGIYYSEVEDSVLARKPRPSVGGWRMHIFFFFVFFF